MLTQDPFSLTLDFTPKKQLCFDDPFDVEMIYPKRPIVLPPHIPAQQLPQEVRIKLKPHASHWIVPKQQAQSSSRSTTIRADHHTQLFIKKNNTWTPVRTALTSQYHPSNLLIIKNKAAFKSTKQHCSPAPIVPPPLSNQAKNPFIAPRTNAVHGQTNTTAAVIPISVDQAADEDEKRIIINIEGDRTISITARGEGITLCRNNQGYTENRLLFAKLKETGNYKIDAKIAGVPEQPIAPSMPYSDYLDANKVADLNIGENGGMQLLNHQVNGNGYPEITLLAQPPTFGVFFDGTGNNRINDNKVIGDDKEPTNVAKLYELYNIGNYIGYHYSEGIGTKAGKSDTTLDLALAYSFDERLVETIEETRNFFKEFAYIKVGIIDIFGFSRGASQARAFANQVHYINRNQPDFWGGAKVMVRFLGIFDTVASTMGDGDDDHSEMAVNDELDVDINLDISETTAAQVMHLVAYDERRDKFPVHSLKTAQLSLASNHQELVLPGAHCDVGGGYGPTSSEIHYPTQNIIGKPGDPAHDALVLQRKAELEREYQWPGMHLHFRALATRINNRPRRLRRESRHALYTPYKVVWFRQVMPELSHYSLHKMYYAAIQAGVPLKPIEVLGNLYQPDGQRTYAYTLTPRLRNLVDCAYAQGPASQAWAELYINYIHHSVKYFTLAHGPEEEAVVVADNGQRELFYNEPTNAEPQPDCWTPYLSGVDTVWRKD
ncbi:T6SS phospholipase effector Tle1-like catalytic domain-containing protein [Flocculibacter collagenilyticus]|uniref:T6SS phospholipase effector Tle1-like catalytic domain-containing protein n=1 Tax=Flocculibacter collagenilyticus TaxID=2744479 RepID=UPI0018F588D8|nr:DUF2235 domain-containing protein [Flocculibacter collagenilyticus]